MNKQYEQVKSFHEACSVEMPDKPTKLDNGTHIVTIANFANTLNDLVKHMKFASAAGFGGEVLARASYMLEEITEFLAATTIEDQIDALADLQYFAIGTNTLMGVEPEEIFNIVHSANMAKVGADGKVTRDETGKIKKPEGWHEYFAPERWIKNEIEQQAKTAVCEVCNGESKPIYGLECPECEVTR